MNTSELIEKVATQNKIPKTQAKEVVTTVFDTIQKEVSRGHDVRLTGFGTFKKATRKARTGRNPATGESIEIPKTSYPKFKAGSEFKEAL